MDIRYILESLEERGYTFNISAMGFQVWYRGVYIGGARTLDQAEDPVTKWQYVQQYTREAIKIAEEHNNNNKREIIL